MPEMLQKFSVFPDLMEPSSIFVLGGQNPSKQQITKGDLVNIWKSLFLNIFGQVIGSTFHLTHRRSNLHPISNSLLAPLAPQSPVQAWTFVAASWTIVTLKWALLPRSWGTRICWGWGRPRVWRVDRFITAQSNLAHHHSSSIAIIVTEEGHRTYQTCWDCEWRGPGLETLMSTTTVTYRNDNLQPTKATTKTQHLWQLFLLKIPATICHNSCLWSHVSSRTICFQLLGTAQLHFSNTGLLSQLLNSILKKQQWWMEGQIHPFDKK